MSKFVAILNDFGLEGTQCAVTPFGSGLINHTWQVADAQQRCFILQQLNASVFSQPGWIAENIALLSEYLHINHPGYIFPEQMATTQGKPLWHDGENAFYRLMPFIGPSKVYDVVESPAQAFEAAKQFGKFTRLLSGFPTTQLHITLKDFHDLEVRYTQFKNALLTADAARLGHAFESIRYIQSQSHLVDTYKRIKQDPDFLRRVTHHDTKISNALFDTSDKGLCVIDLDTVMPGYFISDLGDMLRTYLSPVSEEEQDLRKICVREDYFEAVIKGYLWEMGGLLTSVEKNHLVYAGQFMIYMQALRFLTDYLRNDAYYGAKYEGHNLARAKNQLELLRQITERKEAFEEMILGVERSHIV